MSNDTYTIIISLQKLNETLESMLAIHAENRKITKESRDLIIHKLADEDYITEGGNGEKALNDATRNILMADDILKKMADLITRLKISEIVRDINLNSLITGGDGNRELPVGPGATKEELLEKLNTPKEEDEV